MTPAGPSLDSPFSLVLDARARLAEGPVWLGDSLRFTDIPGRALHRFTPATGAHEVAPMPEEVGCFAPSRAGGIVAAMRSGLWALEDGPPRCLAANPEDQATSRFNDGAVDPRGRLLAGTVDATKTGRAALYRYDRGGLARLLDGITTSNGLAFSPDGRRLYHADTPRFAVTAYDYDIDTGRISGGTEFCRLTPTEADRGRPDGAAVDAEGCYWTALFEGGRIHRYSPRGELLASLPLPAPCPTMPCFGGPDLRTLYVTTAREGRSAEVLERFPGSGGLFAMTVEVPGLPRPPFDPAA